MTNAELVRQLNTASVQCDEMRLRDFGYLFKTAADKVDELLDIISNLHTLTDMLKETVPQWISVKERLPEIDMSYPHHEDYLVQYDSGNMDVASWSNVNRFWTDHVTEPHWNCVQFAEVIAWMPLPQPPKEES